MAINETEDSEDLDLSDSNIDKLAGAITKGIAATTVKKVSLAEFNRRRPPIKLKYTCYQNGYRIPIKSLTPEGADYLNRITRPGRYINRMVEVALWDEGGGEVSLDLRYSNATPDQRFENKNHFRSFVELVRKIVEEQDIILAKSARTQRAVEKLIAQNDLEEQQQDVVEDEPRLEASTQTPQQEAAVKKTKRAPFASARLRRAQADAR